MSLSEDERRELERLRRHYKQSRAGETVKGGLMLGLVLSFLVSWIISYFFPLTRNNGMFIFFICCVTGIYLSYGPFEEKKSTSQ